MPTSSIILRFEQSAEQPFDAIRRIVGFVKLRHLAPLLDVADLESNPRSSKIGSITEAISESLERTPETFPAKTKGLLVGAAEYRPLDRQRYDLAFTNPQLEGILDGGHNALALGMRILRCAGVDEQAMKKVHLWADFKVLWHSNQDLVSKAIKNAEAMELDVLVPVELLVPVDPEDPRAVDAFGNALLDICAARNNNAQLKAENKANQRGYFDAIKELLSEEINDAVEWKNDGGRIRVADIVALSWIPLSLLDLPSDEDGRPVEAPALQNIYHSKGECVARFERMMSSSGVTAEGPEADGYRRELKSESVRSAFKITAELLDLYDVIYSRLPDSYNKKSPGFGRIKAVKKMNPENSQRKKFTKFGHNEVRVSIPEGFVVPLVVGLTSLLTVDDDSGVVEWRTDPTAFIERHFDSVVAEYKDVLGLLDFDPQRVGKAPEAYRMAQGSYKRALLEDTN